MSEIKSNYKRTLKLDEMERCHSQVIGGAAHSGMVYEDGSLAAKIEFPFDEIDRNVFGIEPEEAGDKKVSFSDMSAALSIVLFWICGGREGGY